MNASNASSAALIPSAMDLLLVVPRLAQRAGSLAFFQLPESVESFAGKLFGNGSVIANASSRSTLASSVITNTSTALVDTTAIADAMLGEVWTNKVREDASSSLFVSVLQGVGRLKNLGGIFSYLTSRWALTTFAAAIILNRTQFYASSREHLRLRFQTRLALYMVPVAMFLVQMVTILQALKCQTSPDFAELRYRDPLKHISIDFAGEGGFLYQLSSRLLFWQDDSTCCAARHMSLAGVDDDKKALRGSMSLLYWFFLTLCTSQLFETLCCALQGKQPMPETGMTIFEHSLAFAECEAMISSALGFGFFGLSKLEGGKSSNGGGENSAPLISRSDLLPKLNVPPEVLLVCLISCFSHLSSALLAVLGIRHRVRLVNTAVWACCYMAAFIWSFARIFVSPIEQIADLGVLRFPTVCIVGFIPHLLILVGILICGIIYGLAIIITASSVPPGVVQGNSFRQRLNWAYNNLQANVQFSQNSAIRIKMSEDFYTTLLKIGFNILTAASEAVYLNEGSRIQVAHMTWLEQKRIDELMGSLEKRRGPTVPTELLGEGIARGVGYVDHQNSAIGPSPYARERKSRPTRRDAEKQNPTELDSGLGLTQRRSRMQLTLDFMSGIFWLFVGVVARFALHMAPRIGIEHRPAWLLKAAGIGEGPRQAPGQPRPSRSDQLDFYMIGPDGSLSLPVDDNIDVEFETRRRLQHAGTYQSEEHLGESLYGWWRNGGWFGNLDSSGDFQAREADDDDVTSVISMSTNASATGNDDYDNPDDYDDYDGDDTHNSGRRTPTQSDPYPRRGREDTPSSDLAFNTTSLARLLNPRSNADRDEARLLSFSLQSSRPMTRSWYRRASNRQRADILQGLNPAKPIRGEYATEEEEERDLEQFLLQQRDKASAREPQGGAWESGAEGMGAGGPQCVVCQSTPRTILVWPCGCLSMCDDCRVGLAARNYTKCICCRTDIAAYSRLFVP